MSSCRKQSVIDVLSSADINLPHARCRRILARDVNDEDSRWNPPVRRTYSECPSELQWRDQSAGTPVTTQSTG